MSSFLIRRAARAPSFLALAAALVLLPGVLAGASTPPVKAEAASVRTSDAWVRATPPGASVGAAYATLHNASGKPVSIVSVSADVAETAQIHEMRIVDGMMRMRELSEGLKLGPNGTVELAPGGTHVMLFGLRRPLQPGEHVELRFGLSDGGSVTVSAPVKEPVS